MSKHTLGPWIHDTRGYPHPDVKAACGRKIACTWGVNNQPKTPEAAKAQTEIARANARLIAAAPELLEALKAMEARFGCRSSRQEDQPKTYGCHHMAETCTQCEGLVTGWKAVQAARAAIAKATGAA